MRISLVAVVLTIISLGALFVIGCAGLDYKIAMMDLNAPTIDVKPRPLPSPPRADLRHPRIKTTPALPPPDPQSAPGTVCDDACKQRSVVFI